MTVKEKLLLLKNQNVCVHCPEKNKSNLLGKANYELNQMFPKYIYRNPWLDYNISTCISALDVGNISVYEACHYKIISFKEFMEDIKNEDFSCM